MARRALHVVAACFLVWLLSAFVPSAFARLLDAQALQSLRGAGRAQNRTKVLRKRRRFAPESPAERLLWTLGCELWSAGRDMALAGGSVAKGEIGAAPPEFLSGPTGTTSHLPTVLGQGGSALQDIVQGRHDFACNSIWFLSKRRGDFTCVVSSSFRSARRPANEGGLMRPGEP